MSTVSKKRKLNGDEPKYYAVRAGKTPGVYRTWADCQANTTGFKGAAYKSFLTEQEAKDFVAGKSVTSTTGPGQTGKFYAVAVGHKPGVYTDWDEAKKQVTNIKLPKYKKFETRAEAEEFVRNKGQMVEADKTKRKAESSTSKAEVEPAAKKVKVTSTEASKGKSKSKMTVVYTDGSSIGNGKAGASAGVGVWFGKDDERNVSQRLEGPRQTNQRAELTAILRALQIVSKGQSMEIKTDSTYSINCCTIWITGWMRNGWKTSTGKEVENRDLVEDIKDLIDEKKAMGAETKLTWIKGHSGDPGNEAADKLAVAGAMLPRG